MIDIPTELHYTPNEWPAPHKRVGRVFLFAPPDYTYIEAIMPDCWASVVVL